MIGWFRDYAHIVMTESARLPSTFLLSILSVPVRLCFCDKFFQVSTPIQTAVCSVALKRNAFAKRTCLALTWTDHTRPRIEC